MLQIRRPPIASDAEIRAYLLPKLRAGRPPTYAVMRADLGGGGFSRLVRIRNQIEAELAGDVPESARRNAVASVDMVATLEALFEQQWKTLQEWEGRLIARFEGAQAPGRALTTKAKEAPTIGASHVDRLELVEHRLMGAIDKLAALARAPANAERPEDVPPSWARQAAASAAAALDGRLQSMEETVRDNAAGAKGAFDLAAEIAREVAAEASLQLQVARSMLLKAVRDELARSDQSAKLDLIARTVQDLRSQVGSGFATATATADRRAVAIRDVVIAMTDIEMAQVEMMGAVMESSETISSRRPVRWRGSARGRARSRSKGKVSASAR